MPKCYDGRMKEWLPGFKKSELGQEHGDMTVNLRPAARRPERPPQPISIPKVAPPAKKPEPLNTAWPHEIMAPDYTSDDLREMQERENTEPTRGAPKPDIFADDIPNMEEIIKEERQREATEARKSWFKNKLLILRRKLFKR